LGQKDDRKNIKLKVEFTCDDEPDTNFHENEPCQPANSGVDFNEELKNLRKKYDTVVEYTVHLTAERDLVIAQMSELKKQLNREVFLKQNDEFSQSSKPISNQSSQVTYNELFKIIIILCLIGHIVWNCFDCSDHVFCSWLYHQNN
jgi:hypothetical protein